MIKGYQIKSACLKKGVITELKPGLYPLKLAADAETLTDDYETVTYVDHVSGGLVTMPFSQFRKIGKLNRMYANWNGEKLRVAGIEEFPFHLRTFLDNGYRVKTEEHLENLEGQDLAPISLTEFYIRHGIPLEREIEGTVYTNPEATVFFRNIPEEPGLFIKIVKKGDTLVPFTKSIPIKDE